MKLYSYKAQVISVYDGDTITVNIDLGLSVIQVKEKIRLYRINAPELKASSKKKGIAARNYLKKLILGKEIFIETIKDRKEKYGRYLAEVLVEKNGKLINVNDEMVKKKFAVYKKY